MPQVAVTIRDAGGHASTVQADYTVSNTPGVRDYFGVCIHSTFTTKVYGSYDKVFETVVASGARFVRDRLSESPTHPQRALWRRFRDAGIKVHATIGSINDASVDRVGLKQAMTDMADCLVEVAGFNEPEGATNWLAVTADHQKWLYDTVRSIPALAKVRVVAPPLRGKASAADLSALYKAIAGKYDAANLHIYPGGVPLTDAYLDGKIAMLPAGVPVIVSEGGYNTGLKVTTGGNPVDEQTQADQLLGFLQLCAGRGIRFYQYELLDDPDPKNTTWEAHWGLMRCPTLDPSTWSAKPSLSALAAAVA